MPKKNKLIILSLGFVMILLAVAFFNLKHQMLLVQRHHLLCEVLRPGMSEDEVLAVLKEMGDFTIRKSEWLGGSIELGINFTDLRSKELYGGFDLSFTDYKYLGAYVRKGSDNVEIICDFYQPTQSIPETPKP